MEITIHQDINEILELLKDGLSKMLGEQLLGLYLTGSLTYGDFDRGSSDIDFLAVLQQSLSEEQLQRVEQLHAQIGQHFPYWHKRIEGSYITAEMLLSDDPPAQARPYVNAGKLWSFVYGDEWILNLHVLRESGVALVGPDPKQLVAPVSITKLRQASKNNFIHEWIPKLDMADPFVSTDYDSSHLQAYAILTMCRILYTAFREDVVSKKVAAEWVKQTYGAQWSELITTALEWKHGEILEVKHDVKEFIALTQKELQIDEQP